MDSIYKIIFKETGGDFGRIGIPKKKEKYSKIEICVVNQNIEEYCSPQNTINVNPQWLQ